MARIGRAFPARPIIKRAVPSAGSPDVTVALTGSSVTVSPGTLVPSTTVPLVGSAVTVSIGTLTPSSSLPLSGAAITVSTGTVVPSTTVPLTGSAATFGTGTVTPSGGSSSDVTVALTGVSVTVSAGSVVPSLTVPLTGVDVGVSAGTVTASGGTAVTVASTTAVGGGKPRRKRHYLELDGQYFEVKDEADAIRIVNALNEAAKEAAPIAVKRAVVEKKPAPVAPKMVVVKPDYRQEFVQELQAKVDAANARIAETYRAAMAAEMVAAAEIHRRAAIEQSEIDELINLMDRGIL